MRKVKDMAGNNTLIIINGIPEENEAAINIEVHKESVLPDDVAIQILKQAIKKLEKHEYDTHN